MKYINKISFAIFTIIILYTQTSLALTNKTAIIKESKSYLASMRSIAADFTQTDPHGAKHHGKLLLSKPHDFRCNYYPPYPLLITGSKNFITLYDYEMSQISRIPAKENLLTYLLAGDENLEKYFKILDANDQNGKLLLIVETKDDDRRAHVEFDKSTRKLSKIELVDLNGNITSIKFSNYVNVNAFNPDLFIIKNPDMFGPPARLTKEQIEKKYR
jgi:outer membrane lipoprotein-sorting protein